jgi:hypothetical protein
LLRARGGPDPEEWQVALRTAVSSAREQGADLLEFRALGTLCELTSATAEERARFGQLTERLV